MSNQTIKKLAQKPNLKLEDSESDAPEHILRPANAPIPGFTTFDRKAEEMKTFLSLNPIPEEFLKKK